MVIRDPYQPIHLSDEEFLIKHGIYPIEYRRKVLRQALSDKENKRLDKLLEDLSRLRNAIENLPEVNRLHQLQQLAGKSINNLSTNQFVKLPAFHSRFNHSEFVAELAVFFGIKSGLTDAQIKVVFCAGWLHDIGHSAFSHIGDSLLRGNGFKDHEERAIEMISIYEDFDRVFQEYNVDKDQVIKAIREKGLLGKIQSICDTLSYLVLDSAMVERSLYPAQGITLLASISGLDLARELIRVESIEVWQNMIECRAFLMRHVYYHPLNKLLEESLRQLLRLAIQKGHIYLEEILRGDDYSLRMKLQSLVQFDPVAAFCGKRTEAIPHLRDCTKLFALSLGFFDEDLWELKLFESEEEAMKILLRFSRQKVAQTLIVRPFDYLKKKIEVIDRTTGEVVILQACKVRLREEDEQFIVCIPKFLS